MPVRLKKDKEGCYAQYGKQKKYYYSCGNENERDKAKQKAIAQGIAISKQISDEGIKLEK